MSTSYLNAHENKLYRLLEINFWKMVVTLIVLPTCDSNYEACKSLSPQKQCGRTITGDFFPLLLKYSLVRMKKKISYIIGSFL